MVDDALRAYATLPGAMVYVGWHKAEGRHPPFEMYQVTADAEGWVTADAGFALIRPTRGFGGRVGRISEAHPPLLKFQFTTRSLPVFCFCRHTESLISMLAL